MSDDETEDFAFGSGGFAKLYGDRLADSSLLDCRVATRWVFVYVLSQADAQGRFRCASGQGLARAAAVSLEDAEAAIAELEAPDVNSTSPEEDGRRLIRIPGGWQIVTYAKYRYYQTARQRAEAERKRRQREAARAAGESEADDPSPHTPLPTNTRGQKTDTLRDVQGRPSDVPGHVPPRKAGSATARELATLEADPQTASIGDAWVRAFGRPRRELGVLRAARTALAGGYDVDAIVRVVMVAAMARENAERFPARSSFRWASEHQKAGDPGYVLRAETLSRLIPEAEEWDRA